MNFNSTENFEMNSDYGQKPTKGKKIIIILMIFLLIILGITYGVYSYFVKNNQQEALKNEFFSSILNNDLSFFTSNEIYTTLAEKVEKSDYESSSTINLSTTMENNMFSDLDLSKFEFNYHSINNNSEYKTYSEISTKYAGNDFLTVKTITDSKRMAIKSDEIVNKYVGVNKSNLENISNQVMSEEVDYSNMKKLKNFIFDREYIDLNVFSEISTLKDYFLNFKENTSAENFSKKENVIVDFDSEQVSTTEYTVNLTAEQFKNILTYVSTQIENDTELVSELVVDNVVDFENSSDGILEYTDNDTTSEISDDEDEQESYDEADEQENYDQEDDEESENVVEISGEENNFNTVEVWGENTTNSTNTVSNTTTSNNEQDTTNTVSNTTSSPSSVTINQITTQDTENTVQEETTQQEDSQTEEQTTEEQTTQTDTVTEQNITNQTENTVVEDENLRPQGYIAVNEESEGIETDDEDDTFIIGENYEDTLENIKKLSNKIDWMSYLFTGAKANCTQEELIEQIQKILSDKIEENDTLTIKIYVADGKTVKVNFEIPETSESLDMQIISKDDNEKYLDITALNGKDENANGYDISLYKKNADADVKVKIGVNKIYKNKISSKWQINLETKGTSNSKKYTTESNVSYSDSDGEFKLELANSLNFDVNAEVEDLSDENCLFIDSLSEEELLLTSDAIKQKTIEVLKEKNKSLNIIDLNNSNSIVQQTEQNTGKEDTEAKEEAKQVLIQTISSKMGEYLNSGKELTLEDLEGLEIPDYQVDISFSSNLAIITVNGYKFKLDSDFNLSDS